MAGTETGKTSEMPTEKRENTVGETNRIEVEERLLALRKMIGGYELKRIHAKVLYRIQISHSAFSLAREALSSQSDPIPGVLSHQYRLNSTRSARVSHSRPPRQEQWVLTKRRFKPVTGWLDRRQTNKEYQMNGNRACSSYSKGHLFKRFCVNRDSREKQQRHKKEKPHNRLVSATTKETKARGKRIATLGRLLFPSVLWDLGLNDIIPTLRLSPRKYRTGIEYHPFPFPTLTATFERVIRSIPTCHAKDTKLPEVTYTRHELLRSLAISGYSTSWLIAICGEYFWGLNSADGVVISRSDARGSSCWKYSKGAGVFDLTTGVGCLKD
ncbi:hypothetical protein V1478_002685 [Vespula squamosa]|uniref:Uncharacterized protein n=1 Tax=Vespula squamosa TaxID=30214 RepID=A0ABD2BTA0_VESSQ